MVESTSDTILANWPGKGFSIGDLTIPVPIVQGGMGIGDQYSLLVQEECEMDTCKAYKQVKHQKYYDGKE